MHFYKSACCTESEGQDTNSSASSRVDSVEATFLRTESTD